jgi:hypothetical protein
MPYPNISTFALLVKELIVWYEGRGSILSLHVENPVLQDYGIKDRASAMHWRSSIGATSVYY